MTAVSGSNLALANELGDMPEWRLSDLYPAADSPELLADLETSAKGAAELKVRCQGKLADLAASKPAALATAIRDFEKLQDRLGRIGSYAGLLYFGDTANPVNAKFFGDMQERLTNIGTDLLFFTLELNRIEDKTIETAMVGEPALAHYRPWIEDLRREKPYQLDDKLEELFHEKYQTGRGAFCLLYTSPSPRD